MNMLQLIELNFDFLMDEAEREGRVGICPICEFDDDFDGEQRLLCWCGVCFKYHHDRFFHEDPRPDYPPECFGEEVR